MRPVARCASGRRRVASAACKNTAIEVHDLRKSYGRAAVLHGVSFAVGAGEIFGIAGRNGAGKTSTVEILQGLRRRDGGEVAVLGLDPGGSVSGCVRWSARSCRPRRCLSACTSVRHCDYLRGWPATASTGAPLADAWRLGALIERAVRQPFGRSASAPVPRACDDQPATARVPRRAHARTRSRRPAGDVAADRAGSRPGHHGRSRHPRHGRSRPGLRSGRRPARRTRCWPAERRRSSPTPWEPSMCGSRLPALRHLRGYIAFRASPRSGYDGATADIRADPVAVVRVAAELARRDLAPSDFTVIRPSLEEAVVSLLNGDQR